MIGPFINSGAIIIGGTAGLIAKGIIPKSVQKSLISTFGLIAMAIAVIMLIKVKSLPPVVLALIFGIIIGELISLEKRIDSGAGLLQKLIEKNYPIQKEGLSSEEFSQQFSALLILFTFSGMGILGSLTEGLSGDPQLLLIKSILDFFTAMIFSMTLGPAVIVIFIFQLGFQSALFFLAKFIMPYMDEIAYGDFTGCGGIIMLALGLRISKIKSYKVINFLPALLLVIPFSYLWRYFFLA